MSEPTHKPRKIIFFQRKQKNGKKKKKAV